MAVGQTLFDGYYPSADLAVKPTVSFSRRLFTSKRKADFNRGSLTCFYLDAVKVFADGFDPVRVANGYNGLGQLAGLQVEVVDGAAVIDDKFAFGDSLHKKGDSL